MSVLNLHASATRAIVATDTLRNSPDGKLDHVAKILALPHIGAVVAYRGYVVMGSAIFAGCLLHGGDIDALLAAFPAIVRTSIDRTKAQLAARSIGFQDLDVCEAVCVGPSEFASRMSTIRVHQAAGGSGLEVNRDFAEMQAPDWLDRWSDDVATPQGMVALVSRQVEHADADHQGKVGGAVCVAEVFMDRIVLTRHGLIAAPCSSNLT